MNFALTALTEELKRLHRNGVERCFVSDATWECLRQQGNVRKSAAEIEREPSEAAAPSISVARSRSTQTTRGAAVEVGSGSSVGLPETPLHDRPSRLNAVPKAHPKPPEFELPAGSKETRMEWLQAFVSNCETTRLLLNPGATMVFGDGSLDAEIAFVGEAPNAEDEAAGLPLQGERGKLFANLLKAMGLARSEVFTTNMLSWRPLHSGPTGSRSPHPWEFDFARPFLRAQLEIISPKVIVALGNRMIPALLGEAGANKQLDTVKGIWFEFNNTPLVFSSSIERLQVGTNAFKRKTWEQLLAVMERLEMPISEKQKNFFLRAD